MGAKESISNNISLSLNDTGLLDQEPSNNNLEDLDDLFDENNDEHTFSNEEDEDELKDKPSNVLKRRPKKRNFKVSPYDEIKNKSKIKQLKKNKQVKKVKKKKTNTQDEILDLM